MPVYVYRCRDCQDTVELTMSVADSERFQGWTETASSHATGLSADHHYRRVYTPPAVHFKGSGWAGKGSA